MKKLNKSNIEEILILTAMQEGMLFEYLKKPDSAHYFEQLSLDISGEIDRHLLEESLRSSFSKDGFKLKQHFGSPKSLFTCAVAQNSDHCAYYFTPHNIWG